MNKLEQSKQENEVLRKNIERFVDGIMELESSEYTLVDLLNESFTTAMLDLLFKRMTAKLRAILFSRANTLEFITIALNPRYPRHTRSLATSFLVVGSAASCLVTCTTDDHRCESIWESVFTALVQEAANAGRQVDLVRTGDETKRVEGRVETATVEELEALIRVEVNDIELDGARSLQRSFIEQAKANLSDEEDEHEDALRDSAALVEDEEEIEPRERQDTIISNPPNEQRPIGIYGEDSANFSSQIIRYFALRGQKGACILYYLASRPSIVDLLLANIGHDDTRILLLHLIYSDHSEAAMTSLFTTAMMDKMLTRLLSFGPPRDAYERDCVENTFLLLREIIHAPYLTTRGVAISAKTIPMDKLTGQDEYVSICGASRDMANSTLRKYTSRKVRHLIHLLLQPSTQRLEQLFIQMITELTFWSCPVEEKARRGSITQRSEAMTSLSLLSAGLPRPTCTTLLTHLFELTETVDFSEATSTIEQSAAVATSVGIDCLNFMCSTHLVRTGTLIHKLKLRNELQQCELSVNCMMGLRLTTIRQEHCTTVENGFLYPQGNQMNITLDEIESVETSDWHPYGFIVRVKKYGLMEEIIEYFATTSQNETQEWIELLKAVINGDLNALEIFCSDDWRSNIRDYRRLRECLIVTMARKGHDVMVFLKQAISLNTRKVSGYHLWTLIKFLYAVVSNESKRLDQMLASSRILSVLFVCYERFPYLSLVLGEITKIILFCLGDFKNKRSRRCPIIHQLLQSTSSDETHGTTLLSLLCKAFVDTDGGKKSLFAGTDSLSNLKLLMESIKLCCHDPKTRSQERIQAIVKKDPMWERLLIAVEEEWIKNPHRSITFVISPSKSFDNNTLTAPTQPSFQEHILNQITRPCYFTTHGFGSSFLLGDGCAFGYMFKERTTGNSGNGGNGNVKWQKVLLVYEYVSYKLWYFYPSEVDEKDHIKWKWIIPVSVKSRYTHGHDESNSSVGHHGLYVMSYDHHLSGGNTFHGPNNMHELHFSVTKLEDRDQWKQVLSQASQTLQQLSQDYNTMSAQLKKPDKKTITHCQDQTCQTIFKLFRRPHSCKRCGKWFCGKCTQQRMPIPEVGLMRPVRHCRLCFEAAGGEDSAVEPTQLFRAHNVPVGDDHERLSPSTMSLSLSDTDGASHSYSNPELYELAHGIVSPRSLMIMRRRMARQDSFDSPKNEGTGVEGFQIDELDRQGHQVQEEGTEQELSYCSPPTSPYFE